MARAFRRADYDARLGVLCAHPDLAGKLAAAKRLTTESTSEQASAGLDALTDEERSRFQDLNAQYVHNTVFPIMQSRSHQMGLNLRLTVGSVMILGEFAKHVTSRSIAELRSKPAIRSTCLHASSNSTEVSLPIRRSNAFKIPNLV
jgi:hypothetical protein